MSPGLGGNTVGAEHNTGRNPEMQRGIGWIELYNVPQRRPVQRTDWNCVWGCYIHSFQSYGLLKSQEPLQSLAFVLWFGFYHLLPKRDREGEGQASLFELWGGLP